MTGSIICASCGIENSLPARFCVRCGNKLDEDRPSDLTSDNPALSLQEIERLLKDLQSRESFVRQTAATELGKASVNTDQVITALKAVTAVDSNKYVREAAAQALAQIGGLAELSDWKCSACGRDQSTPVYTNHCLFCNAPISPGGAKDRGEYPVITDPPEVSCYTTLQKLVLILAGPKANAECIYVVGPGDIAPIIGQIGGFYQLLLPAGETGYVLKTTGKELLIGADTVKRTLGYVRTLNPEYPAQVTFAQSDGSIETLYSLKKEDRLPVVEEREHVFKVQLPNGLRGWVDKGRVLRTLASDSLPPEPPSALATAVGTVAAAGAVLLGGWLVKNAAEGVIRRGTDQALHDHGL